MIKFSLAFVIFIFGLILARIVKNMLNKLIRDLITFDNKIKSISRYIIIFFEYIIIIIAVLISLETLGIRSTVLTIIIIILLIVTAIALLITLKDFIINFFASVIILIKANIKVGDTIVYDHNKGKIEKITLTEIIIKRNNELLYIPTSLLIKKGYKKIKK